LADDDLLRPTLSGLRHVPALYSSTGFFVSSFFGGPLAAGVYGAFNSYRLNRLAGDLPVHVALVAGAYFLALVFQNGGQMAAIGDLMGSRPARTVEIVLRSFGLLTCFAIWLLHRRFFRTAQVTGTKSLSGWLPGLIAFGAGFGANQAFFAWIMGHH
jgi:hypothetical protein